MENQTIAIRIANFPLTKILIGLIACGLAAAIAQIACEALLINSGIERNYQMVISNISAAIMVLISYILLFKYYEKRSISELAFTNFWKNALIGFFSGLILQSLVILVIFINGGYSIISINSITFALPAFAIAFASAIVEEILFRGIIFRLTEERLGSIIAIIISSLIFGLAHLANKNSSIYSAIAIALQAGLLLSATYIYARNLWLPIWLHFAWNFAEAGIYGAAISGNVVDKSLITSKLSGPDILTGGTFGPENSLQATLFCAAAAFIFLWLSKRQNKFIKLRHQVKMLSVSGRS